MISEARLDQFEKGSRKYLGFSEREGRSVWIQIIDLLVTIPEEKTTAILEAVEEAIKTRPTKIKSNYWTVDDDKNIVIQSWIEESKSYRVYFYYTFEKKTLAIFFDNFKIFDIFLMNKEKTSFYN